MRLGMTSLISFLFMLELSSCHRTIQTGPSALLIAVEGFSGSNFSCSPFEDSERSGFQILCNEAVRFTHAFAPSPMAQASLGSILTGELPLYNGLRDNGKSFLPAQAVTLAEKLIEGRAHTFFVVSAPTIKRYSRLHQGFENFNDEYDLNYRRLYRPASESFSLFKGWIDNEVNRDTYFGVIHISDLLFPQTITQTEFLEPRPRGFEGQLEEVDENLFLLFNYLKQKKLWDKTYVILTGLNGVSSNSRFNELPGTNLFAENVSVPLFIKPLKGREEIPHQWKVDVHVTLHDIGLTLEEVFKAPSEKQRSGAFNGLSLLPLINGKSDPSFNNRPLMIESAWSQWALNVAPRFSIRDNQWLLIFDKKPLLYNALTDRNEVNRISLKDLSYQATVDQMAKLFGDSPPESYEKPDIVYSEVFRFTQILADNEGRPIDSYINEVRPYVENNPSSEPIRWLMVDQLIRQKKWDLIEEFNSVWQDAMIEQMINIKEGRASASNSNPCLDLIPSNSVTINESEKRLCVNHDFLALLDLFNAPSDKKEAFLDRFAIQFRYQALQLKLIYFDLSRGGIALGANTKKLRELMMFRLTLGLPKFQKEAAQIEKRINI